jgi:hypothetical protein
MWPRLVTRFLLCEQSSNGSWMRKWPNGWNIARIWTSRKCQKKKQLIIMKFKKTWYSSTSFFCFFIVLLFTNYEFAFLCSTIDRFGVLWYIWMGECMIECLNIGKNYTPYKLIQDSLIWFKWTWLLLLII